MKKLTLLLMLVVMCSSLVFAEDLRLLIEYFSWINCPHCPYSQAGLQMLEDYLAQQNMSDRYLIIKSMRADGQYNTPQSPGHSERCNLYNNSGVPYTKFQGTNTLSVQDNNQVVYNNAVALWNNMNANINTSAFSMSTVFGISEDGYLTVQATATILRTTNYYTTEDTVRAVDFANSRMFMGVKLNTSDHIWEVMAFDINGQELSDKFESFEVGQTATFDFVSTYRPTYPLNMYSAFSFIQRYVREVNPTTGLLQFTWPEVYQSSMANFSSNFVYFSIENPMGYTPFIASFNSLSYFPAYSTSQLTYAWDFEGDGTFTSNVFPQPYAPQYAYNAPGRYTVSLKITTPLLEEFTYTRENAITVLAAPTVRELMGEIGTMTLTNDAPWRFIGNATVTYPATLTIQNGATIYFDSGVSLEMTGHLNVQTAEGSEPTLFTTTDGQTGGWGGISLRQIGSVSHPVVTIRNAIFENAACAVYASYRNILIEDCEFRDNTSVPPYELSPALYLIRVSDAKINRSVFRNNYRGAIGMETSTVTLKNCLIVNNTGNSSGGLFARFKTTLNIDYCTFYNNRREGSIGGTIFSQGSGSNNVTMNITNTILEGNPPIYFNDPTGKANISYTNFINHETDPQYPAARFAFGAEVLYKADNIDPGTGFIPIFMNPTAGTGYTYSTVAEDWILQPNSIVVDKGIPTSEVTPPPTYVDVEDTENPGMAMYPARGTTRADLGFYGGRLLYQPASDYDETIVKPKNIAVAAYPNPFNPSLNINVGVLNIHERLNIAVYNVKGQKIKNLHDGLPTGNNFTVVWNGNDENGVSMASGVYFIRVNNETEQDVKKVLLLK